MADVVGYQGVNLNNLRKSLYLLFFGVDDGKCNDFSSPKYQYILPLQGNFENPVQKKFTGDVTKDTYIMYWIEKDESLTRDDYLQQETNAWSRQKCVASILVRFIGKQAETWVKVFRHLAKRSGVTEIWSGVCNAEKLEYTSPVIPRRIAFAGLNSQIAFDVRFKLYYDEVMSTGWEPVEGIDMTFEGTVTAE